MSSLPEPFSLNPLERQSPAWLRLVEHLDDKLAVLRSQNDAALNDTDTAHLRGRIAQLKVIRALADEPRILNSPP